jgi:hypothetical protein
MLSNWGLDFSSNPLLDVFKHLDFNQFEQFLNDMNIVLDNISVDNSGNSLVLHDSTSLEH